MSSKNLNYRCISAKKAGVVDRYAIITEEMGCFHPITWILGTDTGGKILDVSVMIYREVRGHETGRDSLSNSKVSPEKTPFKDTTLTSKQRIINPLIGI